MKRLDTAGVIGLGTIGGSVARGLAARGVTILAHDSNASHLESAIDEGIVSRPLARDFSDIGGVDAVVIAVDVDSARAVLTQIEHSAVNVRLVTDVGSTKRAIVAAAQDSKLARNFVGSHPFAGDHRSGWSASRADMFEGKTAYVCPTSKSSDDAIGLAESLWRLLGAEPVRINAEDHDRLLAWTSHLPHMVSTALALALAHRGIEKRELGSGGRDVVRLAAGSPDIWTAIAADNASEISSAVAAVEHQLGQLREVLARRDRDRLRSPFEKAQAWAERDG